MRFTSHQTTINNALKAEVYVYGMILEIAFLLFMIPMSGFIIGLFFSFSKKLQYGSMGIALLLFLLIWLSLGKKKGSLTVDTIMRRLLYQNSVTYIQAEYYNLLQHA